MDSALVLRRALSVWLLLRCGASVWCRCVRWSRVLLARVCARGPRRAAVHVRPASLLPIPFSPEGWQQWSPATVRSGWALTVCLCSYDARFSRGVQVVMASGVSRLGIDGWGGLRWGCPLSVGHPPISGAPSPVYRHPRPLFDGGAPCFERGGCLRREPPCL